MSLDPNNYKLSCAVGFACLDREGTLIHPHFQPFSHNACKTLCQSGNKGSEASDSFQVSSDLKLYKSTWINGSFKTPLNGCPSTHEVSLLVNTV